MAGTIKLDFDPIINYFKTLSIDMIAAWSILVISIILIIVGLITGI